MLITEDEQFTAEEVARFVRINKWKESSGPYLCPKCGAWTNTVIDGTPSDINPAEGVECLECGWVAVQVAVLN